MRIKWLRRKKKGMSKDGYNVSFNRAVNEMKSFYENYYLETDFRDSLVRMYKEKHLDPDGRAIRYEFGVKCTADTLLSIRRICNMESDTSNIIPVYERYNCTPIFFFPSEIGGINTSRSSAFGDRIDLTLFDIKMYYSGRVDSCRLKYTFERENTKNWLQGFGSFEALINWLGIKGIFTDERYNVFDLESCSGETINSFNSGKVANRSWSLNYYENVKNKIEAFQKHKQQ